MRRAEDAKKGHTEEQIVAALQRVESGERVGEICRGFGDQRGNLLPLKETVRRLGIDRTARVVSVVLRCTERSFRITPTY